MKYLITLFTCFLSMATHSANLNATDNVETYFRYGTEWYDSSGNLAAWTYLEVGRQPWPGGHKYYAYWAARVCCDFDQVDLTESATDPIEFPWPPALITVPDIDPSWTAVSVNALWAYDYPDYATNEGYPTYLFGYAGEDNIWVDAQDNEILLAFGNQPEWWASTLSAKTNRGKHLGQHK